ncbi:MAG TPA: NmrA/HSCARG family protein [Saprospiraceae bacterium]|nr:NmrA/HSCARG family protein [Saprospiraceae bacterium]
MPTIFVTGATGNQGGAAAEHLLKNGFHVKGLTRNPDSPKAQKLKSLNAEVIKGDLEHPDTFRHHLENVDGVFNVQTFEITVDWEIKQGMLMASLAKQYNVPHYVYSSVAGADLKTGIPHFESKLKIEDHIKQLNLPFTIIRPASLLENHLLKEVRSRIVKGKLVSPVNKNVMQQFVAAYDIGKLAAAVFANKEKYLGKTITVAAEQYDQQQMAAIFSEAMGRNIKYQKLPMFITRLVMGKDLYKMFSWINANSGRFIKDLPAFRKDYPDMMSVKEWVSRYFKDPHHISK